MTQHCVTARRLRHPQTTVVGLVCLIISACAPVTQSTAPSAQDGTQIPVDNPIRDRQPPANAVRFSIVSANSEMRILTFRDGPMARFGHNHVILSRSLSGSIWQTESLDDSLVRIVLPVNTLSVDEPAERAAEGDAFSSVVDEEARDATRANMLGESLLNAQSHAFVRATCSNLTGFNNATIDCAIDIAGSVVTLTLPIDVTIEGNQLVATGEATVTHEQLGLTPYSAAGGAIRVADGMTLRYSIKAQRLSQ
ncbi:MAG: hypothetical protein AAGA84_10165 [Pseudomonadota bacterium]